MEKEKKCHISLFVQSLYVVTFVMMCREQTIERAQCILEIYGKYTIYQCNGRNRNGNENALFKQKCNVHSKSGHLNVELRHVHIVQVIECRGIRVNNVSSTKRETMWTIRCVSDSKSTTMPLKRWKNDILLFVFSLFFKQMCERARQQTGKYSFYFCFARIHE